MSSARVVRVERLDFDMTPREWPFARARREDIAAHFDRARRERPQLWNGRVLLMHEHKIEAGTLHGAFFETDFASFMAWRDWGFPGPAVWDCFAMGALRTADGAFVLGVMGAHTANAGAIYFPSGTPEPADVAGGKVDIAANLMREMTEETGLSEPDFTVEPGWDAVFAGARLALMKGLRTHLSADDVAARIRAFLASEAEPELSDIRIVHGQGDIEPAMPDFVTAYLAHGWK